MKKTYTTMETAKEVGLTKRGLLSLLSRNPHLEPQRDVAGDRIWTREDMAKVYYHRLDYIAARFKVNPHAAATIIERKSDKIEWQQEMGR